MKKINLTYIGVIALILFTSFTRIIPHMPNFTPIGAMALFGGAYLSNKYYAIAPIGVKFGMWGIILVKEANKISAITPI